MTAIRLKGFAPLLIAVASLAGIGTALATAPATEAAGLRNCVDIAGRQFGQVGCYELVWADGAEVRMTFANQGFGGTTPQDLDPFYVIAPQTATPQGPMSGFPHDHVVRAVPAGNDGSYSTKLQGTFVFCTGQGIVSGACVPTWLSFGGPDPAPFATTVDGQPLTSAQAIESAAAGGHVVLVNLGPAGVIVGTVTRGS